MSAWAAAASRLLEGMRPFASVDLPRDVLAGVTLAALAIPSCLGYARIAGMPVVTGLYTLLLPLIAFAVFGASRSLVVAADSSTAAIMAAAMVAMAIPGSPDYVSLAGTLALFTGVLLLVARWLRLGFLADFLAQSALVGFLAGTGIHIVFGELADLAGAQRPHAVLPSLGSVAAWIGSIPLAGVATFGITLGALLVLGRLVPRFPGALVVVILATAASGLFDLASQGVATIGSFARGLPTLGLPTVSFDRVSLLATCTVSVFVVAIAKSSAVARSFANRHRQHSDTDGDVSGLAAANLAASISGAFVVSGSATKTEMVDAAGGRSQVAHLTTAMVVAIVLVFFTQWLAFLPLPSLSAIVFLAGTELIDVATLRALAKRQRDEFVIAAVTALVVLTLGLIEAVAFALVASLVDYVRRTYQPRAYALRRVGPGQWERADAASVPAAGERVAGYRFEASLFYANSTRFSEDVASLAAAPGAALRAILVDASGIDTLDFTSATMLQDLCARLADRHVVLALAAPHDALRQEIARYGLDAGPTALQLFPSLDAGYARFAS